MKKMTKKLHQWAKAENCHVWELTKQKLFWQPQERNGSYKWYATEKEAFMSTYNGFMIIQDGAYEMYDATQQVTILVTQHGVVNKEKVGKTWQLLRK